MSKKSAKESESTSVGALTLYEKLKKRYGEGVKKGSQIPLIERFSTGIAGLDVITGGGWPIGRICEIAGKESTGKTAIMLQCCKTEIEVGQEPLFVDLEGTLAKQHLSSLGGTVLDLEETKDVLGVEEIVEAIGLMNKLVIAYPSYGEEAIELALAGASEGARLTVIDSLPLMEPKVVMDKLQNDLGYKPPAMSISAMFNNLKSVIKTGLEAANATMVLINQVRDNVNSVYGGTHTPGGHAIKHLYSIQVQITHSTKDPDRPGVTRSHLKVEKNKTWTPYLTTEIPIVNGVVQLGQSLIFEAAKVSLVDKKGSWYKLNSEFAKEQALEVETIGQGEAGAGASLEEQKDLYKLLYKEVLKRNGIQ
jgi:recombination protein RecA